MKKRKVLSSIILIIIILIVVLLFFLFYGKSETLNLTINNVNLSLIPDGVYSGKYVKGRFNYKVEVFVKNNKIESIKILNQTTTYLNTDKIIINRVLEKQSLDVDVVTGATATSKGILKAIENALNK
ncbi:MAG: FMN-binding protein [Caldisericia bacterium]|nr:FMN-binding protein [Caldisericia bacterium]